LEQNAIRFPRTYENDTIIIKEQSTLIVVVEPIKRVIAGSVANRRAPTTTPTLAAAASGVFMRTLQITKTVKVLGEAREIEAKDLEPKT
jgi:hypothetical protein